MNENRHSYCCLDVHTLSYACFFYVAFLTNVVGCVSLTNDKTRSETSFEITWALCSSLWHLSSFPAATLPTQMTRWWSFLFLVLELFRHVVIPLLIPCFFRSLLYVSVLCLFSAFSFSPFTLSSFFATYNSWNSFQVISSSMGTRTQHAARPKGGRNKSRRPAVRTKFDAEFVPRGRKTAMCKKARRGHPTRAQPQ